MIHTFADYLNGLRLLAPALRALIRDGALYPARDEGGRGVSLCYEYHRVADPQHREYCRRLMEYQGKAVASGIDAYLAAVLVSEGPKVFRPTAGECGALSEVELRLPVSAYAQPFPTLVVEFPREWSVTQEIEGGVLRDKKLERGRYRPLACVSRPEAALGVIMISTLTDLDNGMVIAGLVGDPAPGAVIEDDLARYLVSLIDCSPEEHAFTRRCARVALNCGLLLMDRGFRRSKETNEAHIERTLRRIEKNRQGGEEVRLESNEVELALTPVIYEFAQAVDVRKAVGIRGVVEEGISGRKVKPHWRSSHWRMQPCGVGRSELKRILIPHCLIHKELFAGEAGDTTVILE